MNPSHILSTLRTHPALPSARTIRPRKYRVYLPLGSSIWHSPAAPSLPTKDMKWAR